MGTGTFEIIAAMDLEGSIEHVVHDLCRVHPMLLHARPHLGHWGQGHKIHLLHSGSLTTHEHVLNMASYRSTFEKTRLSKIHTKVQAIQTCPNGIDACLASFPVFSHAQAVPYHAKPKGWIAATLVN